MTWAEEDERDKITSGKYKELREVAILTRRLIPDFPPHVVALCLSEWGSVVWTSTDAQLHPRIATECYPWVAEYQLSSPGLPVVTRSQLTVIGRLGWGLDKVTHDGKVGAFKYHPVAGLPGRQTWYEIQHLARLPRHPSAHPVPRGRGAHLSWCRRLHYTLYLRAYIGSAVVFQASMASGNILGGRSYQLAVWNQPPGHSRPQLLC